MGNRKWIIVLIFVAIAGILIYMARTQIYTEMSNLKLIPHPEQFTELYFTDPTALPAVATLNVETTLSFTVHNLEGATTTYPYEVYFDHLDGIRDTLVTGSITLSNGETRAVTVPYTLTGSDTQGKVGVILTSLNQEIDFLVPSTN